MLNKILKGLIGLVILSILVFIIMGLPKTNHQIESSFTVEKPIEEVYDYLRNIENGENWIEGFISAKKIKGNASEVGSVYDVTIMEFGKAVEKRQTLTSLTPFSMVGFEWDKEDASGTVSFELEPVGQATEVNELHTFQGKGLVSRFIIKAFKKYIVASQSASQAKLIEAIEG